jgi:hypothetical protein
MPATIPIRLMMTCPSVNVAKLIPKTMMRSPVLEPFECYDSQSEIATATMVSAAIQACGIDHIGGRNKTPGGMPESFA